MANNQEVARIIRQQQEEEDMHDCHICLSRASYAVISFCGHLFCWPCIYMWMKFRPSPSVCPTCASGISRNTLIPVHGTYDDRHLANEVMVGIPERMECPSIESQRRSAMQKQLPLSYVTLPNRYPRYSGINVYEANLPGLQRVAPLHPLLMPKDEDRIHLTTYSWKPMYRMIALSGFFFLAALVYFFYSLKAQQ